jgi:hypothetical protein
MDTNLGEPPFAPGLSDDPLGRISLAYAEGEGQDHDILWAVVQDAGLFRNETFLELGVPAKPSVLAGVYLSQDNGQTWQLKATPAQFGAAPGTSILPLLALQSGPGIQAWYDQYVEVDPVDADPRHHRARGDLLDQQRPLPPRVRRRSRRSAATGTPASSVASCEGAPTYEGKTTHPDQHAAAVREDP